MPGPVGPESVIASLYWQFHTRWHETRHLIVDPISSPVSRFGWIGCKAWVLSAASPWYPAPPTSSHAPVLNDAFSKPHICDCLYCAFPRNHLGATSGAWLDGGEVCPGKPPKPFGRSAFSYWSLQTLPTLLPSSAETFAVQPIQEPKYFPPNCLLPCSCWRMRARAQYVPMKRQNLSKTLKVAKKSISSHKLFIIIVTSTIHYATENNCKEISQDRKLVRKNAHAQMSGRLPN